MRILLIGYGRMGKIIEQIALSRGHEIVARVDRTIGTMLTDELLSRAEVAIEFTQPNAAYEHCRRCLESGLAVVSGTTGWSDGVELLRKYSNDSGVPFFWASNFSVGVHLFAEINERMAKLMSIAPEYSISMSEIHHIHKLDAPSGTVITLAERVLSQRADLSGWLLVEPGTEVEQAKLPITSIREGEVPGTHSIEYRSAVDCITLTHEAFGREGFALGAVLAAEFTRGKRGNLDMRQMLQTNI